MSRLDELGIIAEPPGNIVVMYGCFRCQTCNEDVEEAHWSLETTQLAWICEAGHTSRIKEFSL